MNELTNVQQLQQNGRLQHYCRYCRYIRNCGHLDENGHPPPDSVGSPTISNGLHRREKETVDIDKKEIVFKMLEEGLPQEEASATKMVTGDIKS